MAARYRSGYPVSGGVLSHAETLATGNGLHLDINPHPKPAFKRKPYHPAHCRMRPLLLPLEVSGTIRDFGLGPCPMVFVKAGRRV
jgi:hypothetical protein